MKNDNLTLKNAGDTGNEKFQSSVFIVAIFLFSFFFFLFNSASADIATGLVSHYKLDETTGTIADDSVGTNNGTLTNGPTWITGKIGNGLSFDGTDDYVNIGDKFYSDIFTICAWFKADVLAAGGTAKIIAAKRNGSGVTSGIAEWEFRVEDDKFTFVSWNSSGVAALYIPGATTINLNQWYHGCSVQSGNGNTGYLYLNGVEDDNAAQTSAMRDSASLIQIGARTSNNNAKYWDGLIDDVRIYNRALSPTDIAELYNYAGNQSSSSMNLESPENFGVETLCNPSVNLFWTAPNGQVQSYNIENIGVWGPTNTTNIDYADSAVAKDTYYIYDVTAVYSQGESAPASILVKTPSDQECQELDELTQNCPYSSDEASYKYVLTFNDSLYRYSTVGSTIPTNMSAGSYKVSLASIDTYTNRVNNSQPNEQWYISLKNSSGNEIAKTASSTDLEDNVAYAYKQEVVNESLAVSNNVVNVQAMWGGGWYPQSSGSLWGICGYFEKIDPATGLPYGSSSEEVSIDSFTATPNPVDSGSATVLSWTSSNADYCTASGGWNGFKSLSGSTTTLPIYGTTTFALKCVSADRTSEALASVIVNINSGENTIISLNCQPSPQIANIGQDITWTANPEPPSSSYTYSWSGDDNLSGSSQTVTKSYSTTGTKIGIVDIGGATNPQQCTGTVRITASPSFDEF